ncbi:MAG: hypothetical protein M3436_20515, partial [Pseudomonadota bacterium]|nr:hypothetical protein [Pseudomonadota bacterium]
MGTSRPTVLLWRKRFEEAGPSGLSEDAPHGLSVQRLSAEKVNAIVQATLHTKPEAATHWSTRTMGKAQGVSHASVARIWDAHGLQPHRIEGFKLSKDKRFVEKLTDVVGVYLNPPDKALVLCVDEKSQVQALDRRGVFKSVPELIAAIDEFILVNTLGPKRSKTSWKRSAIVKPLLRHYT